MKYCFCHVFIWHFVNPIETDRKQKGGAVYGLTVLNTVIVFLKSPRRSLPTAPVSPADPLPARRGAGHDGGPGLSHPSAPLLPRDLSQHPDVGPPGASKHPQALEPELPAARTPAETLGSPLLQGGQTQTLRMAFTSSTSLCQSTEPSLRS